MSINRLNLISLLNARHSSSNYNCVPVTDTDASRWKMIMKLLRFIIILMMRGSDAECLDLYHQRTQFRWSACCSASEHRKHPILAHTQRVVGPLSPTNMIPMLGYITTAIYIYIYWSYLFYYICLIYVFISHSTVANFPFSA